MLAAPKITLLTGWDIAFPLILPLFPPSSPLDQVISSLLNVSVLHFTLLVMTAKHWPHPHLSWLNDMCTGTGTITWRPSCSLSHACKHTSCSSATPTCFTSCQFLPRERSSSMRRNRIQNRSFNHSDIRFGISVNTLGSIFPPSPQRTFPIRDNWYSTVKFPFWETILLKKTNKHESSTSLLTPELQGAIVNRDLSDKALFQKGKKKI